MSLNDLSDLIRAVSAIIWPVVATVIVWRLFPVLKSLIERRDFTVEVAGTKISFQKASDDLATQLEDVKQAVVQLRQQVNGAEVSARRTLTSILWVNDRPHSDAFEISGLHQRGVKVSRAMSTVEALELIGKWRYDLVVSDLNREEGGELNREAGFELAREMRRLGFDQPVVIYTGRVDEQLRLRADRQPVAGITASPTTLLELIEGLGELPQP